jgi:uncharacterized protein YkwD
MRGGEQKVQASNYNPFPETARQQNKVHPTLLRGFVTVAMAAVMVVGQSLSMSHQTVSQALPSTSAPARSQYFAPTGKSVAGDFLGTMERFGLERIGYPLSEERQENGSTVQYFERVRMERHPELTSKGYSVLMTRLGAEMTGTQYPKVAAFKSTSTRVYVKETGHSISGGFLTYWKANGGVELFGYPISEPMSQNGMTVQWFERARFEYHPELAKTGKTVQLSLLGKIAYEKSAAPQAVGASQQRVEPVVVAPAPAPAQAQQAPAQAGLSSVENYLLTAMNQQRTAAGLQPVQVDGSIVSLARSRSDDMAERNYFSHTTPEGKNFLPMMGERKISYKFAGEILARNNYPDAEAAKIAIDSYLGSAAHKAIMLDGRFNLVGVGYTKSAEDGMQYYTVIFVQR